MANLTVTIPNDEMGDLVLAITPAAPDADTLEKQIAAGSAWLTERARDCLWTYQQGVAAEVARKAVPDPMPEEG